MTEQELKEKYPAYYKSIFSDFMPDNQEVMGWQENVLEKMKGDNILPHYVEKDRDFDMFWGWITHFFAIIVYFGRNFKKFFTNYLNYLNEVGEFMKEKDYIKDSRTKINKDLKILLSGEVYHNIFCNFELINGVETEVVGYNCTDYIPIYNNGVVITLKVLGYNESLNEYSGENINDINIAYYQENKTLSSYTTLNITAFEAKNGYRFSTPINVRYIRISYPILGDSTLPLYLGVFLEGIGSSFEVERTEQEIFNVYSDFRKRGTFKSSSLIKKILESKEEDNFYADYLSQVNTGWFLNKNAPIFGRLYQNIKIDSVVSREMNVSSGVSTTIVMRGQYFVLNQNTSLIVKWKGNNADSVLFNMSIYDKDKNLLTDTPILSDWSYDSVNHTLISNPSYSVLIYPKYDSETNQFIAELPIEIIDNLDNGVFNTDTYDKFRFVDDLNKICLFTKYNNSKTNEAYYVRVTSVVLNGVDTPHILNSDYNSNFEIGIYLRKLPIMMGFLNNKQYYLCCFKNNGSYSNSEAKEIIDQKVIPYNGYRLFIDNSYYKDITTVSLDLKEIYFDKINKKIHLEIIGGVPPYTYELDLNTSSTSYLPIYESFANYGTHLIIITDSLGKKVLAKVSCQPFNNIDYKFKIFISRSNYIQTFIKLLGGTETSYLIKKSYYYYPSLYDSGNNQLLDFNNEELLSKENMGINSITIPSNVWIDITNIIGENLNQITKDMSLYIRDNGIPVEAESWLIDKYNDLEFNLQSLFLNFGLDFYDNGIGELVN